MRSVLILAFCVFLVPVHVCASDGVPADDKTIPAAAAVQAVQALQDRPAVLIPLYAGSIALQTFDTYSTLAAVRSRGVEQNPLVGSLAGSPVAFIAVKSGVTVATVYVAERLWRRGHRAEAIAMLAVSNGLMAAVAINNVNVLQRMR